jgi:hypothetical protein
MNKLTSTGGGYNPELDIATRQAYDAALEAIPAGYTTNDVSVTVDVEHMIGQARPFAFHVEVTVSAWRP